MARATETAADQEIDLGVPVKHTARVTFSIDRLADSIARAHEGGAASAQRTIEVQAIALQQIMGSVGALIDRQVAMTDKVTQAAETTQRAVEAMGNRDVELARISAKNANMDRLVAVLGAPHVKALFERVVKRAFGGEPAPDAAMSEEEKAAYAADAAAAKRALDRILDNDGLCEALRGAAGADFPGLIAFLQRVMPD